MAKPLNIPPYSLVRLHLVCNGTVEILLDLARTLDVKRVIDQRILVVGKVPANRVTRRVSVSAPGLNRRRNKKQPKEHGDRRQSNDTPDNQIGLLRQFGPLHLIGGLTLVCISPTTAFVGSASDSSTLCLLARRFELPFGIRRFAVRASFWESRLGNRYEDDGKDDQRGNDQHAALQARLMAKPLDVSSYFWVGFYFILSGGGIIDVPLDFAWVLDVKRVIEQWIYVANEIPPDWMARRILISPSRRNCWRNEKQPEEHDDRRQSNDTPRNQIGLLRQLSFLSLVAEQASIPPKGHLDCL